ncbi:MAG: hypothetical protein ACU85V_12990 [Gammaproteobacteria bacterium]
MMIRASCIFLLTLAGGPAGADAVGESEDAGSFLEFESVLDGRCQILSEGGKLRVIRNRHASSAIEYRLVRIFAGKRQGLSTGVAPPGAAPVKLGCTRVDGRPQQWEVERARFQQEET